LAGARTIAAFLLAPALCIAQGYLATTAAREGVSVQPTAADGNRLEILGPGVLAADGAGNVFVTVRGGVIRIDAEGARTRIGGATPANFNPRAVAIDTAGNLFLADTSNNRIRRLDATTSIITTVAGTGVRGFSGDGGLAIDAQLDGPAGLALDGVGNLYIADGIRDGNQRIRKISASTGIIDTIAGNGTRGYSGNDAPATLAQFHSLGGLAADASGNLYIADNFNHRIRMVSAATGIVTTVAGTGTAGGSGDGGLATGAELNNPLSLAIDAAGDLYMADAGNFRIRKITASTGVISTVAGSGKAVYPDTQHGYPCALALDATENLYIADFGASRVRKIPADIARETASAAEVAALPHLTASSGFKINVTYDPSVPAAAQTAFNSVISAYESLFSTTNTVNVSLAFGNTGLGQSLTEFDVVSYSDWRAAMMSNASANPGNTSAVSAAATLPAKDPIGSGDIFITSANARELGFIADTAIDTAITASNAVTYEYTGTPSRGAYDFMDVVAHELDEGLAIGSALTGLQNNAAVPTDFFEPEDYFRYSAPGTRALTTDPNAVVYFSYDGGNTNVAQFNQQYSVLGDSDLDRNDWIYGNSGCPAATPHIQDAVECSDQAVPVGQPDSPEVTVLNALGYNSGASLSPQTFTSYYLGPSVDSFGSAPFTIGATASSGLPVTFSSSTPVVCTVSGTILTIVGTGTCTVTASQAGNSTWAPLSVSQSFTVVAGTQQIAFPALPNLVFGAAPFLLTAAASSGLPVRYSSTTPAVCTVSGSTVSVVGAGACTIVASQAGNGYYTAASPVTRNSIIGPGSQTIAFAALSNIALGAPPFPLMATAASGLLVTFTSLTPAVCTIFGEVVTLIATGTCTITASQAGNANYIAAASVTQSFMVNPAQTIAFGSLPNLSLGAPAFNLMATSSSGLTVTFTAGPSAVCTVTGVTVAIMGAGVCSITASQLGSANYGPAATVTQSFTVTAGPKAPTIKIGGIVPIYSTSTTIQPGSWISIFGSNLAAAPATWNNDFPTMLGGVTVTIDGKFAYLWYVNPTQINLQAPTDNTTGNVAVTLTNANGSWTTMVTLAPVSPSFSELDGKHVAGIILRAGGAYDVIGPTGTSLGYPTVAAKAGDTVVLFGVGFGPTNPVVTAGQFFSGAAPITDAIALTIGGTSVIPSFAGLSYAGLYQINLTIPAGLGTGDLPLAASIGGAETQSGVVISLQ
jgi:uncharacterized protein (TIGR03437 family)